MQSGETSGEEVNQKIKLGEITSTEVKQAIKGIIEQTKKETGVELFKDGAIKLEKSLDPEDEALVPTEPMEMMDPDIAEKVMAAQTRIDTLLTALEGPSERKPIQPVEKLERLKESVTEITDADILSQEEADKAVAKGGITGAEVLEAPKAEEIEEEIPLAEIVPDEEEEIPFAEIVPEERTMPTSKIATVVEGVETPQVDDSIEAQTAALEAKIQALEAGSADVTPEEIKADAAALHARAEALEQSIEEIETPPLTPEQIIDQINSVAFELNGKQKTVKLKPNGEPRFGSGRLYNKLLANNQDFANLVSQLTEAFATRESEQTTTEPEPETPQTDQAADVIPMPQRKKGGGGGGGIKEQGKFMRWAAAIAAGLGMGAILKTDSAVDGLADAKARAAMQPPTEGKVALAPDYGAEAEAETERILKIIKPDEKPEELPIPTEESTDGPPPEPKEPLEAQVTSPMTPADTEAPTKAEAEPTTQKDQSQPKTGEVSFEPEPQELTDEDRARLVQDAPYLEVPGGKESPGKTERRVDTGEPLETAEPEEKPEPAKAPKRVRVAKTPTKTKRPTGLGARKRKTFEPKEGPPELPPEIGEVQELTDADRAAIVQDAPYLKVPRVNTGTADADLYEDYEEEDTASRKPPQSKPAKAKRPASRKRETTDTQGRPKIKELTDADRAAIVQDARYLEVPGVKASPKRPEGRVVVGKRFDPRTAKPLTTAAKRKEALRRKTLLGAVGDKPLSTGKPEDVDSAFNSANNPDQTPESSN